MVVQAGSAHGACVRGKGTGATTAAGSAAAAGSAVTDSCATTDGSAAAAGSARCACVQTARIATAPRDGAVIHATIFDRAVNTGVGGRGFVAGSLVAVVAIELHPIERHNQDLASALTDAGFVLFRVRDGKGEVTRVAVLQDDAHALHVVP